MPHMRLQRARSVRVGSDGHKLASRVAWSAGIPNRHGIHHGHSTCESHRGRTRSASPSHSVSELSINQFYNSTRQRIIAEQFLLELRCGNITGGRCIQALRLPFVSRLRLGTLC
ncbi:hypothetical protein MRX96_017081 [Rhipicephalus microplus]